MTTQPNKTKASFEPRGPLACELCASCGIISEPSRIVWRHVEQALRPHTKVGLQARPQAVRFFEQGCERVTLLLCPDCGHMRGLLAS